MHTKFFPELIEQVKRYHNQTKHDFHRYARALGYLDWANQPNPFRRYEGAPLVTLPILATTDPPVSPSYHTLYQSGIIPPQPVNLNSLSRLLEYALSITAWKEYGGNRWALRSNPSSGNLHPTEGYVLVGHHHDLSLNPGLYHYAPKDHDLEYRLPVPNDTIRSILSPFPPQSFLVGLSSIQWREAWKYGERAFRYCQHDIGHAIGTLRIAAATLGWQFVILSEMDDATLGTLLGLNRTEDFDQAEPETPEILALVLTTFDRSSYSLPLTLTQFPTEKWEHGSWQGKANRLSRDNPIPWEIIDDVTRASWKFSAEAITIPWGRNESVRPGNQEQASAASAGQIIHQRRSALAFDGKTSLPVRTFFTIMERAFPQSHLPVDNRPMPWDAIPWNPTIHLALFVHRVVGLSPGLYMLLRKKNPDVKETFQQAMHEQFVWKRPELCPAHLPLYLLEEGNAQNLAIQLSCWQDIAGKGAFAVGMVAEFETSLEVYGPCFYRRLFWETGLIGQVLYLEAEAAGVRATGIGCFFDNPVHQVLGFPDMRFQSLYHFTIGGHVEDQRLTTLPPYELHKKS